MKAPTDPILLEILAELKALRVLIESTPKRGRAQAPPDLAEHLQTIADVVENRVFSVSELLEHAAIPEGEALRSAIVGLVGALNGKRLGKLLRGIEGEEIGGLRIERLVVDRLGVLWRLRVCGFRSRKPASLMA